MAQIDFKKQALNKKKEEEKKKTEKILLQPAAVNTAELNGA